MAEITATDTFDEEELEPDTYEQIEPFVLWVNENMQNIVSSLRGELGDRNLATQNIQIKAENGIRKSVSITGKISNVSLSRIESQPESQILITGFNWWPTTDGFDFTASFSGDKKDRTAYLRIDFDV